VVSRETAGHVKVALSGDGGDELFAGYRIYAGEYWHSIYGLIPTFIRRKLIEPLLLSFPDSRDNLLTDYSRRIRKFISGSSEKFEDRFHTWNQLFSQRLRQDILQRHATDMQIGRQIIHKRLNERCDDPINRMLYADMKESLPGDMLHKVDAMSMLNSLEVRVPFLDHRVCEFAFSLPGDFKIKRGKGKYILLETFRDILPLSLQNRPKWGFEVPIGKWLKKDLRYLIDEYLSPSTLKKQEIFHTDIVDGLVRQLFSGRRDTSWQVWNLIVFQNWYARHIDDLR
jgi:asparagine synthase (glutamine-hydrolysing)